MDRGIKDQKRHEFEVLLERIGSLPRPKLDYRQAPAADFLALHLYHRLSTYHLCYMVLHRTFAVRLSLADLIACRGIRVWPGVSRAYPHRRLFAVLEDLDLEAKFLDAEMERRLKEFPLTCALIRLDPEWMEPRANDLAAVQEVVRLLGLDKADRRFRDPRSGRIVTKSRPQEDQDDATSLAAPPPVFDEQQEALWKVFEEWRRPAPVREYLGRSVPPPVPVEDLLHAERELWDGSIGQAWEIGGQAILNEQVPILSGERESIGREARRHVFNEQDRIKGQRSRHDLNGQGIVDKSLDLSPGIDERLIEIEVVLVIRKKAADAYRVASIRWKKTGRRFVRALLSGKNHTEASKRAGISRQTGQKYLRELYRDLS